MWAAAEHTNARPLLVGHDDWWEHANMATGAVPLELSRLLDTVVKVCDVADEEHMLSDDVGLVLNRRLDRLALTFPLSRVS